MIVNSTSFVTSAIVTLTLTVFVVAVGVGVTTILPSSTFAVASAAGEVTVIELTLAYAGNAGNSIVAAFL